jgi:deoxyribodipyrimidine photolyase
MTSIVWFRQDLRRRDNPALTATAAKGPVVPLYILDDVSPPPRHRLGAASRWWLHHSLEALRADLGDLLLLRGDPRELLPKLARDLPATSVFWNRCYEPFALWRDASIKASLRFGNRRAQLQRRLAVRALGDFQSIRGPVQSLHPVLARLPLAPGPYTLANNLGYGRGAERQ